MDENNLSKVKAMTFDVFGTVVDWRSSVAREIKKWVLKKDSPWIGINSLMNGDQDTSPQ